MSRNPYTSLSRSISSKAVPNSQFSVRCFNWARNIAIVSPGCRERDSFINLNRCTIADGLGITRHKMILYKFRHFLIVFLLWIVRAGQNSYSFVGFGSHTKKENGSFLVGISDLVGFKEMIGANILIRCTHLVILELIVHLRLPFIRACFITESR